MRRTPSTDTNTGSASPARSNSNWVLPCLPSDQSSSCFPGRRVRQEPPAGPEEARDRDQRRERGENPAGGGQRAASPPQATVAVGRTGDGGLRSRVLGESEIPAFTRGEERHGEDEGKGEGGDEEEGQRGCHGETDEILRQPHRRATDCHQVDQVERIGDVAHEPQGQPGKEAVQGVIAEADFHEQQGSGGPIPGNKRKVVIRQQAEAERGRQVRAEHERHRQGRRHAPQLVVGSHSHQYAEIEHAEPRQPHEAKQDEHQQQHGMHLGKGRRPGLGHQPEEQGENQVEGKFIEQRPGDAVVGRHVDAGDAVEPVEEQEVLAERGRLELDPIPVDRQHGGDQQRDQKCGIDPQEPLAQETSVGEALFRARDDPADQETAEQKKALRRTATCSRITAPGRSATVRRRAMEAIARRRRRS